jgi:hypothetical protein
MIGKSNISENLTSHRQNTNIDNRLAKEEKGSNWLYAVDQLAPLEIYN